jgi:hypothetical protein
VQWLIPVVMGLWAIWTWSQEREQERTNERARLAALYVNPFLSACEDLQSRIYNILERGGLRTLRKRYPDGAYAEKPFTSSCDTSAGQRLCTATVLTLRTRW